MSAGDRGIWAIAGVGITVCLAPRTAIVCIGIVSTIRVITFDVCEIKQDFIILPDKIPDLIVALVQVPIHARPVEMPGHINKPGVGVISFKPRH